MAYKPTIKIVIDSELFTLMHKAIEHMDNSSPYKLDIQVATFCRLAITDYSHMVSKSNMGIAFKPMGKKKIYDTGNTLKGNYHIALNLTVEELDLIKTGINRLNSSGYINVKQTNFCRQAIRYFANKVLNSYIGLAFKDQ